MTNAKLIQNPVNPNLEVFRKEMKLINVTVYPEMLVFSLPSPKRRESCIPEALALINKIGLPLEALRPGSHASIGNTFIVKSKSINNENSNYSRNNRTGGSSSSHHQNTDMESQNTFEVNAYIPFDSETADLEQAYLNDLKSDRLRYEELDRIGNSFERISEQLSILHAVLNQESEAIHA